MRIDAHQHFWKYTPKSPHWINKEMEVLQKDFLPNDLKPMLDKNGIDGTVAVQSIHSEDENKFLLRLAKKHDWIKGVIGWADLKKANVQDTLEKLAKAKKFKGLRHNIAHARDPRFMLNYPFNRGVSHLKDYDLVFEILIYQRQMKYAIEFVQRHPYTKMILNDMAKPLIKPGDLEPWASRIREMAHCENLYCKISGLLTLADWKDWKEKEFRPYFDVVFEAFGPERVIFGADWPISLLAAPYAKSINVVSNYLKSFSEDEKSAVMGGNAVEFYGLE